METPQISPAEFNIRWPEPPDLTILADPAGSEECEIEFKTGSVERGRLLHFTGRDAYLIFQPNPPHAHAESRIVVNLSKVRQVKLIEEVGVSATDGAPTGESVAQIAHSHVQVYNVEFADGEITSGETLGAVRLPIGLFLFFERPDARIARLFIPTEAIAYSQLGDPLGQLLVEENAVSEEQLKEAVTKQQEMRKLVLGDYLIERGYITATQLDFALEHQKSKPSLRVGEALIELGFLKPESLQAALAQQRANRGRPLSQILMDMGVLNQETLQKVRAKKLGLPFVSLSTFTISAEALGSIPAAIARRLAVVPLAIEDGALIVASARQPDSSTMHELELVARMRVVAVIALDEEIVSKQLAGYGAPTPEPMLSDPSAIRFPSEQPPATTKMAERMRHTLTLGRDMVIEESVTVESERALMLLVQQALATALDGGVMELRVETEAGVRRTRLRVNASKLA